MLIHLKEQEDFDKVESLFNEIREESKPKLMTFGDLLKFPSIMQGVKMGARNYVKSLCKYSKNDPWLLSDGKSNNDWFDETIQKALQPAKLYNKRMENQEDNGFFHASKCRFLIDEWKKNGWYSYPQGVMKPYLTVFFHPGSCRQYAMYLAKMVDQPIIFWDCQNEMFDREILDYETWSSIFTRVDKAQLVDTRDFAEGTPGFAKKPILEWHVDENRPMYYLTAYRIQSELFNFRKPRLFGDTLVEDVFEDNSNCLEIHMKDNKTFVESDLDYIMQIPFEEKEWECPTFTAIKSF